MLARDIEMFIEHCGLKGLSTKTINSYEQTLRLFMQYMDEQGILLTEKITHLAIQGYIKSIKERGKYTVTTNPNSGNYPDRRVDFGKRVSDVTINNYLRNLRVFFNWCVEEELILRSPVKKGDFVIQIQGISVEQVYAYADKLLAGRGGVGIYPPGLGRANGWVHVDVRKEKSRWRG